jgi:hypothetical protein
MLQKDARSTTVGACWQHLKKQDACSVSTGSKPTLPDTTAASQTAVNILLTDSHSAQTPAPSDNPLTKHLTPSSTCNSSSSSHTCKHHCGNHDCVECVLQRQKTCVFCTNTVSTACCRQPPPPSDLHNVCNCYLYCCASLACLPHCHIMHDTTRVWQLPNVSECCAKIGIVKVKSVNTAG